MKSVFQKANNLPPINAEYTEIRRKFYSATLGDFGETRRVIFSVGCGLTVLDISKASRIE
jgi:hypothetical protein